MQSQDSQDPTGISSTGPRAPEARASTRKANAAVQMALAGATWAEIALALGYPTARTARVATEKALEKQLKEEDKGYLRKFAGARLERLLLGVWSKAIDPASPEHLIAVTKARELIAQHAKLYGLDAPTEIVVSSPSASELEAWVARVVSIKTPAVEEYDILEGEVLDDQPPREIGA